MNHQAEAAAIILALGLGYAAGTQYGGETPWTESVAIAIVTLFVGLGILTI